jgi:hypothetical protein
MRISSKTGNTEYTYAGISLLSDFFLHRKVGKDHAPFRYVAHSGSHPVESLRIGNIPVVQDDLPASGAQDPDQRLEQCSLAHPVAAHDRNGLSVLQIEGYVSHYVALSVEDV